MEKVEQGYALDPHVHAEADARHLDAPLLHLDLPAELAQLRQSEPFRTRGSHAKTLAKYPDLRVVLLAFAPGARLENHQTRGRVCIHALEGHLLLKLAEETVELRAGGLLQVAPSIPHEVEAVLASALLLTIAWPARTA